MTKIKEIRKKTEMTQQEFASYLGIPLRTLQNWEQGTRNPPKYLIKMIEGMNTKENKYNYMFAELQKQCERENCCNAFRHITLDELIELNYYLDRLIVFCENLDPEYLEDLECGDKILDFYRLANNLFDRDL